MKINFNNLEKLQKNLRKLILEVSLKNGGHISTSFSCVEIMISIFFGGFVNINKKNFKNLNRNTFTLSKGHAETIMYSFLSMRGLISKKDLFDSYQCGNHYLGGHVDHNVPGVELTTGSLGHGLGFAAGLSLANKMDKKKFIDYVLIGDAECTEGSIWEAALFASFHNLKNLVAIIDRNGIGSLDHVKNFTKLDPLKKKWESFGWKVQEINGHSFKDIFKALKNCKNSNKPNLIIANTIKGKGLSIMENDPIWHFKKLDDKEEIKKPKKEIGI